ncbi:1886_t:CDS:1, partial [Acaulospora colombiana]
MEANDNEATSFAEIDLSSSANFGTTTLENTSFGDADANTSGTTTPTHEGIAADNINNATNLSSDKDKFAKGLSILLKPVIEEMDTRIIAVKSSQSELNKEIERLLA